MYASVFGRRATPRVQALHRPRSAAAKMFPVLTQPLAHAHTFGRLRLSPSNNALGVIVPLVRFGMAVAH